MTDTKLDLPATILVGTGVVGEAILATHLAAGLSVCVVDRDEDALRRAIARQHLPDHAWEISQHRLFHSKDFPAISLRRVNELVKPSSTVLIESIPERQDIKESFYAKIEKVLSRDTVLCTNTSTLRITELASGLEAPQRFCGMHFFMPVENRDAVEVIRGDQTCQATYEKVCHHVKRLGKVALKAKDTPGFIVNRLLSPYLNESMRLLCRGISAERMERAAKSYGMPMSPLELIDTIGLRTVFDAGRVYWRAFPKRMDPSPLLAGLIKAKRWGIRYGGGVYDYEHGQRKNGLPPVTQGLIERYQDRTEVLTDEELVDRLAVVMFIEAANALRAAVIDEPAKLNLAMSGGLGYGCPTLDSPSDGGNAWLDFFDRLGSKRIIAAIEQSAPQSKSMQADGWLISALKTQTPSAALAESIA